MHDSNQLYAPAALCHGGAAYPTGSLFFTLVLVLGDMHGGSERGSDHPKGAYNKDDENAASVLPSASTEPGPRAGNLGESRGWGISGNPHLWPLPFQSSIRASRGTIGGYFLAGRSMTWWPVS